MNKNWSGNQWKLAIFVLNGSSGSTHRTCRAYTVSGMLSMIVGLSSWGRIWDLRNEIWDPGEAENQGRSRVAKRTGTVWLIQFNVHLWYCLRIFTSAVENNWNLCNTEGTLIISKSRAPPWLSQWSTWPLISWLWVRSPHWVWRWL